MMPILQQCQAMDEEFLILVQVIDGMLSELSQVGQQYVSSKMEYLKQYSYSLKSCQIDARIHRNQQIRNLIEYIKMHRQSKVKSVTQICTQRSRKKSLNQQNSLTLSKISKKQNTNISKKNITDASLLENTLRPINMNTFEQLIKKQNQQQQNLKEQVYSLLLKCMNIIEQNKRQFPEYDELNHEFSQIKNQNQTLTNKIRLQHNSLQVKEIIQHLMTTQESFQSYLNQII